MNEPYFIDMDGVIADAIAGACDWTGLPLHELVTPGEWEVPLVNWETLPEPFWASLPLASGARDLMRMMDSRRDFIITAVVSDECYAGKITWLRRHFPAFADRVITTHFKYLCAGPQRVLYDDKDENIRLWEKAGGIGRLVPRIWNSAYKMFMDVAS